MVISSQLDLGHIIAVSLDNQPLSTSRRILLQALSEEKSSGFATEPVLAEVNRIIHIGADPWQVKRLQGTVRFKRADAFRLTVTALDFNGCPLNALGSAQTIGLQADTLYYLISRWKKGSVLMNSYFRAVLTYQEEGGLLRY